MSLTGDSVYPNYQKDLTQPDQLHRDTRRGIAVQAATQADASNKCAADLCSSRLLSFKAQPDRAGRTRGAATGTRRGGTARTTSTFWGEIAPNCQRSGRIFLRQARLPLICENRLKPSLVKWALSMNNDNRSVEFCQPKLQTMPA